SRSVHRGASQSGAKTRRRTANGRNGFAVATGRRWYPRVHYQRRVPSRPACVDRRWLDSIAVAGLEIAVQRRTPDSILVRAKESSLVPARPLSDSHLGTRTGPIFLWFSKPR